MNAQLLNAVRHYRSPLIWEVIQGLLSYLKYLFGACVILAIIFAQSIESSQTAKMIVVYVCGSFISLTLIGAIAYQFNLKKIRRECKRLRVSVKDWNKAVKELKTI